MLSVFSLLFITSFIFGILRPFLKLKKLGKVISYEQAAKIIADFFPEIDDKLLNVLQLYQQQQLEDSKLAQQKELLLAGIEQKSTDLKAYQFVKAVNLKKNLKYLKYLMIPVFILLLIFFFSPTTIISSTQRIINYQEFYEKPAPFQFEMLSLPLSAVQQQSFTVEVKLSGAELPEEVFLFTGPNQFKMSKRDKQHFYYTFRQLQKDIPFHLEAAGFRSQVFNLKILPKPSIYEFQFFLNYPSYIGKKQDVVTSTGDLILPQGTSIKWQIRTTDVDSLLFIKEGSVVSTLNQNGTFIAKTVAREHFDYRLVFSNRLVHERDSLAYSVTVIPDEYPKIQVQSFTDSLHPDVLFFYGNMSDDYGFTNLLFHLTKSNTANPEVQEVYVDSLILSSLNPQDFWFQYDYSTLMTTPGDELVFSFEVFDNDGFNGSKSTLSQAFTKKTATIEELKQEIAAQKEEIEHNLEKTIADLKKLSKEYDQLVKKLIEKKNPGWEERKAFEHILEMQKNIQQQAESLQKELANKHQTEQKLSPYEERILEKQQELEKLFDQLFDEEMKKQLNELQQLMQSQMNKEQMEKALQDIKLNNATLEKELDRNLSIFKQLEFDKKMNDVLSDLSKLKEEQQQLNEATEQGLLPDEEIKQRQDQLAEDFSKAQDLLDEAEKLNQELEEPMDLNRNEELEKTIQQDMKAASDQMSSKNKEKAKEKQQAIEKNLDQLLSEMEQQLNDASEEQDAEDAEMLRRLLKNIVRTSQEQEKIMETLKATAVNSPIYPQLINRQSLLNDDIAMILDSVYTLGKRQPQIATVVSKEIRAIRQNSEESLQHLLGQNNVLYQYSSIKNSAATAKQQYGMTALNNLSLLLAESLKNMEENGAQSGQSGGKSKSKKGNPSAGKKPSKTQSARKMQEELNKRLEQLRKGMQNPGAQSQGVQKSMSEELARSAAQQEAVRRMLQQVIDELKQQGTQPGGLNSLVKEMEEIERELVNKVFSGETLNRQQKILSRLLEAEKAELEREQESRREAKEAKEKNYEIPDLLKEFEKQKKNENELMIKYQPLLTPFYKTKVNTYFNE